MPGPDPQAAARPIVVGGKLALSFIGVGFAAFAVSIGILATGPAILLQPHMHPLIVAHAHLWLPGFLLSAAIGSVYQLLPVVLGSPMRISRSVAWSHFWIHTAGVALLAAGFIRGRYAIAAVGGGLIALGAVALFIASWRTFLASSRRDTIAWTFVISASWLALTIVIGIVLAINRSTPFLPISFLQLLRAHAHLGFVGFFLTIIQGPTFQLVPMFTMGEMRRPGYIRMGVILTQVGLIVLFPGLALGFPMATLAGGIVITAGIVCSAVALVATLATRRRGLEPGFKGFVVGSVLFLVGAPLGLALAVSPTTVGTGGLATAYGVIVIVGALGLSVAGTLCRIVPFLVWLEASKARGGSQGLPPPTSMSSPALERAWLGTYCLALVLIVIGILVRSELLLQAGVAALAIAAVTLLVNMGRVVAYLSPRDPAKGMGSLVRDFLLPREHGSWSLAFEPIALSLLAAPSAAGGLLGLALAAGFFARRPAKIAGQAQSPELRGKAMKAAAGCIVVAVAALGAAIWLGGTGWLPWLLPLAGAAGVFAWFDLRGEGREEAAEIAGAAAFALAPAAFAVLGGWSAPEALALALIVLGRSVPTVLCIRTFIRAAKTGVRRDASALVAAVVAVAVAGYLFTRELVPVFAVIALGLLAIRTFALLVFIRPAWRASRLGQVEAALGAVFVLGVALAWRF